MKMSIKIIIIFLFFCFTEKIICQKNNVTIPNITKQISKLIEHEKSLWELSYHTGTISDNRPKTNKELLTDFTKIINGAFENDYFQNYSDILKLYKDKIDSLILRINFGSNNLIKYLYNYPELPFGIIDKDNKVIFLFAGISTNNIYNTLKFDSKERASKIISSMILPSLNIYPNIFSNTKIKFFGISISYGCSDFSDEQSQKYPYGEVITIIFSLDNCKKFVDGEITDQELIDSSNIYLSDKDMLNGIKKVKMYLK